MVQKANSPLSQCLDYPHGKSAREFAARERGISTLHF